MLKRTVMGSWWRGRSLAIRDASIIVTSTILVWLLIERTETCDAIFDWIAENPDAEADSVLLAFILSSFGVAAYATRRYREAKNAMREQSAAEDRAHALAFHDPLTGLLNRRGLGERLEELTRSGDGTHAFGLLILDLDRFKAVNDVHGHLAGDRLLQLVAERMQTGLAPGDTAYRLGGDEFALICQANHDFDAPRRLARKMVHLMSAPFEDGTLSHHIGASIGISLYPTDAQDQQQLLRRADIALYRAKEAGRNQHRSFEPKMDAEISRRAVIEQELRAAIQQDELRPFYQPVVDLSSGTPIGFEMLARWPRGDDVDLGPEQFVPIAEESGLINEMMLQLLRRACHDAAAWDPALTIAINISPVQLKDPWLSQKVLRVLTDAGFPAQRLAVEITENALIADADNAKRTVESFKSQGMTIGLDDFGTGYSSLHHLRLLPFDKIKIDRSFVSAIDTDAEALQIVRAIVGLAGSLGLPVVAEGIETEAIARKLQGLGCAQGQGYHFGRALAAPAVTALLKALAQTEATTAVPQSSPQTAAA